MVKRSRSFHEWTRRPKARNSGKGRAMAPRKTKLVRTKSKNTGLGRTKIMKNLGSKEPDSSLPSGKALELMKKDVEASGKAIVVAGNMKVVAPEASDRVLRSSTKARSPRLFRVSGQRARRRKVRTDTNQKVTTTGVWKKRRRRRKIPAHRKL